MKRFLTFFLIFALIFTCGCAAGAPEETVPTVYDTTGKYPLDTTRNEAIVTGSGTALDNSTNSRVFYHIFVGSFSDSNNDGIGDLRGIIDRFDYINDGDPNSGLSLGAEGIWLSPIFTSPSYHKYDAANYYEIDPDFGTMEDLQELIELCHERGVKIILDLVINHSSPRNPWFQEFVKAQKENDTESEYYDLYTWSEDGEPGRTWYPIAGTDKLYEGNFSSEMPELNFDGDAAKEKMVELAKYYLDMGIDGFRFDAAKYIYYGETTRNYEFWDWYMGELRAIKPDVYTVAEVWDSDGVTIPYFSSTNCFNFSMAQTAGQISQTAKGGDVNTFTSYVENYISQIQSYRAEAAPVTFIANHDTDRAAGFLPVSNGQAKVAANLSILMPGSTFIYYGEEIGLKGSRGGSNTDANRRLAMLWGDGDTISDPEGADYSSEQVNGTVQDHLPNGDSLYSHYKKLIHIRKSNPEIASGTYKALKLEGTYLGGFVSTLDGSSVVVLHNTTTEAVQIDLSTLEVSVTGIVDFAGMGDASLEGTLLTIAPQTSVVLK